MRSPQASVLSALLEELNQGHIKVVDLTTPLDADTPVIDLPPMFAPSPGLSISEISRYDSRGPAWYWNTLTLGEHTGTHFDAPVHWITGKDLPDNTTDTIPARKFVGPACIINVTAEVAQTPDFLLTREHVAAWEKEYGHIPAGAWVVLHSGWSQRKGREAFLNAQQDGAHSPGVHQDCMQFLIHERDILGLGVETVGTDAGQAGGFDPPFPSHTLLHGSGRFGLTSLINVEQLPATGAIIIAAPLKIVNGSGSPVRAFAITP